MTDRVHDDLRLGKFVKHEIRIRWRRQATNDGVVGAQADFRMMKKNVQHSLNAGMNARCALG